MSTEKRGARSVIYVPTHLFYRYYVLFDKSERGGREGSQIPSLNSPLRFLRHAESRLWKRGEDRRLKQWSMKYMGTAREREPLRFLPPIPRCRSSPPFPAGFAPRLAPPCGVYDVRDLQHAGPDSSLVRGARSWGGSDLRHTESSTPIRLRLIRGLRPGKRPRWEGPRR